MPIFNTELVKKELHRLNLIKIIVVLFTFAIIAGGIYCIGYNPVWSGFFATLLLTYFLVLLYCNILYCDYLVKTAYILIATTFGYQSQKEIEECRTEEEFKIAIKDFDAKAKIFSNVVFKCGLFRKYRCIEYVDYLLSGIRDNYKFTIQDFLLKFKRNYIRTNIHTRYKQLTVDTMFPINCNIIIKKNKLIKLGLIKKLKPMRIGNKEFEKNYEIYTDNFEEAKDILNENFLFELLKYNKLYGKKIEIIITPKIIFLLDQITIWDLIFKQSWHWDMIISPKKQFDRIWNDINNFLNILSLISLLDKKSDI